MTQTLPPDAFHLPPPDDQQQAAWAAALQALHAGAAALQGLGASSARVLLHDALAQLSALPQWGQDAQVRSVALGLYAQAVAGAGDVVEGIRTAQAALLAAHEAGCPNAQAQDLMDTFVYHLWVQVPGTEEGGDGLTSAENGLSTSRPQKLPQDWASTYTPEQVAALGAQAAEKGHPIAAEAALRWAICKRPTHAPFWHDLAMQLLRFGHVLAAIAAAQRLTQLTPKDGSAWWLLGACFKAASRNVDFLQCIEQALELEPDNVEYHNALASAYFAIEDWTRAEAQARTILERDAANLKAQITLPAAMAKQGRWQDAIAMWEAMLPEHPHETIYQNLVYSYKEVGDKERLKATLQRALALFPNNATLISNNIFFLSYQPDLDMDRFFETHLAYGRAMQAYAPEDPPRLDWDGRRRLRVGFVSSDLGNHPVGMFLRGMLPHLAEHVDVVLYSTRTHSGAITQALHDAAHEWVDCTGLDDHLLLRRIRSDGIDVLLDMNGHTDGNRLSIFARRAAPVQASWIGYFATTGLSTMDWILCDDITMPADQERYFVERPARITPCYLSWRAPDEASATPVGPLPMLDPAATGPTFGCFSNLNKINPEVLAVWRRLLQAVPGSRLLIKNGQLNSEISRQVLRDMLQTAGIDAARVTMEGPSGYAEYFAAHQRVDVMLDTWPYPGGTTTADALFMGVPVVNLRGRGLVGGIGTSIIKTVGLEDFLARDEEDYLRIAKAAVENPEKLAKIRSHLREQLLKSDFADVKGFADKLAQVFEAMARIKMDEQKAQNPQNAQHF